MTFLNIDNLHWLWLVVVVAVIVALGFVARRRRLRRFASDAVLGRLVPAVSWGRRRLRAVLTLAAMLFVVVGLLDPRWGRSFEEVRQQGIDLFVVLDVSRSMLAEDIAPNRLERAKQYARDLVSRLGGDRVGLITVAGTPTLACPLTVDYGAFGLALAEAGPEMAPRGGSLFGDALRLAGESFTDEIRDYKAVVILTDGEDHGSYPVEAAAELRGTLGVKIYTVGIGDADEGARIPIERDGQRLFLTHQGQEVWSVMDADTLRDIALAGGGQFIPAGRKSVDLGRVYEERIAPATKRLFGSRRIERRHVQYQWFAAAALALLLVESVIGDRRQR